MSGSEVSSFRILIERPLCTIYMVALSLSIPRAQIKSKKGGVSLAYAQLYLCLAALFRRFEMELFETNTSDVEMRYDMFLPEPKRGSKGVRVLIK